MTKILDWGEKDAPQAPYHLSQDFISCVPFHKRCQAEFHSISGSCNPHIVNVSQTYFSSFMRLEKRALGSQDLAGMITRRKTSTYLQSSLRLQPEVPRIRKLLFKHEGNRTERECPPRSPRAISQIHTTPHCYSQCSK